MSHNGTKNTSVSVLLRTCDALFVDSFTTEREQKDDHCEVERLYDENFGGGARWERPIYDLRRNSFPVAALCHVVRKVEVEEGGQEASDQKKAGQLVAALRFWAVRVVAEGRAESQSRVRLQKAQVEKKALLFGPLAVRASEQGKGLGKALVERNIAEARRLGYGGILISGIASYYRPFGFKTLCVEGLDMPRPSPGHVLMGLELKPHFLFSAKGKVLSEKNKTSTTL